MYTDLKLQKPNDGDKVWIGVDAMPMNPRPSIYKNGKFWDADDETFELFPTHWHPMIPFCF